MKKVNGVLIIPTGIGCEIGGDAGDANPVAKLIGACCDKLVLHPNVVNASDINEMPDNALYVEGSQLDKFLKGHLSLIEVKSQNKILVVVNKITPLVLNAVNAAIHTIGADIEIVELYTPLKMISKFIDRKATGDVYGWEELCKQVVDDHSFDALAIYTPIDVDRKVELEYYRNGGINPWGGVEAKASKLIANIIGKPVAHAPYGTIADDDLELTGIYKNEKVRPRVAAEAISNCFLQCVFKGLNRAPKIELRCDGLPGRGLNAEDIDFMITPNDCFGEPHQACLDKGVKIICVKENRSNMGYNFHSQFIYVQNYWEAAGIIQCMKAGIKSDSVRL